MVNIFKLLRNLEFYRLHLYVVNVRNCFFKYHTDVLTPQYELNLNRTVFITAMYIFIIYKTVDYI